MSGQSPRKPNLLKGDGKFKPEPPEMGYFQMKLRDREGVKDNKKDKCDKKEDKKVKKEVNEGKKEEKRKH